MNQNKILLFLILLILQSQCQSQKATGMVSNVDFDKEIASIISFKAPVISVKDANKLKDIIYLDAREKEEFDISHIPNARFIGFDHWSADVLQSIDKNQNLVVYCSVGYRSEKIALKLKSLGYKNVQNLYGSIFEWSNEGLPLENNLKRSTHQLHTYNKAWSKWVTNEKIEKVW